MSQKDLNLYKTNFLPHNPQNLSSGSLGLKLQSDGHFLEITVAAVVLSFSTF
jgi:hypothetical protein